MTWPDARLAEKGHSERSPKYTAPRHSERSEESIFNAFLPMEKPGLSASTINAEMPLAPFDLSVMAKMT
jgi:hypothetical protein